MILIWRVQEIGREQPPALIALSASQAQPISGSTGTIVAVDPRRVDGLSWMNIAKTQPWMRGVLLKQAVCLASLALDGLGEVGKGGPKSLSDT